MSVFKRANWHSGLTYKQVCESCKTAIEYDDYKLDYRPWYPDGFVYCPRCKTPLRHNEKYAINNEQPDAEQEIVAPTECVEGRAPFCSKCGHKFDDEDLFCPRCGAKRK